MNNVEKAPTVAAVEGRKRTTGISYQIPHRLSTAAHILLLLMQIREEGRLRRACWTRLESVLRKHYSAHNTNLARPR